MPEDYTRIPTMLISRACVFCNQPFVWRKQDDQPGTVYSQLGVRETQLSGACESCFDDITSE